MVKLLANRLWNNLIVAPWIFHRHFPSSVSKKLQSQISETEKTHSAEFKIAIEESLDLRELVWNINPRDKAIQAFNSLQVWDTSGNNGVLLYVLLSEHKIEIVTDRAITALKLDEAFQDICSKLEKAFIAKNYILGLEVAIDEIAKLLQQHFPATERDANEVADELKFM